MINNNCLFGLLICLFLNSCAIEKDSNNYDELRFQSKIIEWKNWNPVDDEPDAILGQLEREDFRLFLLSNNACMLEITKQYYVVQKYENEVGVWYLNNDGSITIETPNRIFDSVFFAHNEKVQIDNYRAIMQIDTLEEEKYKPINQAEIWGDITSQWTTRKDCNLGNQLKIYFSDSRLYFERKSSVFFQKEEILFHIYEYDLIYTDAHKMYKIEFVVDENEKVITNVVNSIHLYFMNKDDQFQRCEFYL